MAGQDEDDYFDDDDLDALPHDTLLELENNAIQFTQAQAARAKAPLPSSDYGDEFDDEDLDDAVVIDESRSTAAIIPPFQRSTPNQASQHQQFRQQRYGAPSRPSLPNRPPQVAISRLNQPSRSQPKILPVGTQHDSTVARQGSQPSAAVDIRVDSLVKQIEELQKQCNALKDEVTAKTGEIAIVRSKQDKTMKEHERDMAAIRKLNDDKLAKQQKALEAARIAEQNAATERDFIKRDLAEEAERVRRLNKEREADKKDSANLLTTPKKKKNLAHRDGFDDDEIELLSPSRISPSKFQRRAVGSPSKPGKRKRKTMESPAGALEVIQPDEPVIVEPKPPLLNDAILAKIGAQDDRFDFLGTILDHRVNKDHLRSIEELGKLMLPSSPQETLQSKILSKIPEMGVGKSVKDLPIDFCELLISMWQSCLDEKYYTPIYLFMNLLSCALEMKTSTIAPRIVYFLVPIAQKTAELVAIDRFWQRTLTLEKDIDVSACMSLLHLTALGCMSTAADTARFWKYLRWDFVIVMLSANQPREDFSMMLRLLSTSIMKESFGPTEGEYEPDKRTGYIIDRLLYPIIEVPLIPRTQDKVDSIHLAQIRLEIIQLLISMTRSPYTSKNLALHPNFIGQIVCLISDELDVLYDFKSGHELSARIVSQATRLLNHLVTKHDKIIDMQRKLSVVHGGSQKYLLCLSRLNFSEEDLIVEAGIDSDVAACALELLELFVTPEEGESIQSAFSNQ